MMAKKQTYDVVLIENPQDDVVHKIKVYNLNILEDKKKWSFL